MADTANFAWTKPTVGGDNNAWGTILNQALDDIDDDLNTVADAGTAATAVAATFTSRDASVQKKKYISYAAFVSRQDEDDVTYGGGSGAYVEGDDNDTPDLYASFDLPVGVVLNQVDLICDKNGNNAVQVDVFAVSASTGAVTNIGTGQRTATGVGAASATGIAHTVAAEFLTIKASLPSASARYRVYGAIITYTRSNLSQTD